MKLFKLQKGFSLIELMVAVSIFAIVMLIGTGAILAIVNGNKKNQSMQVAISNLNYAVENMTRNMKTGRSFPDIDTGGYSRSEITFITTDNENVRYFIVNDDDGKGSLMLDYLDDSDEAIPVTAPEIDIDTLAFNVVGADSSDGIQPAVIILIEGRAYSNRGDLSADFSIHTSVTQRAVDF